MKLARTMLVTAVMVTAVPASVSAMSAAELSNPWTIVFDVECDIDGDGSREAQLRVATLVNGTSTGHVIGTTSQANVLAGVATITINDQVREVIFPVRPGLGIDAADCVATGSYVGPDGLTVQIAIRDLRLLITPARS